MQVCIAAATRRVQMVLVRFSHLQAGGLKEKNSSKQV